MLIAGAFMIGIATEKNNKHIIVCRSVAIIETTEACAAALVKIFRNPG